jgi:hypothetical protein
MKKYVISEGGDFYKASLHNHSTLSDGQYTPEEIKEMYQKVGYSILAITDHEYLYDHSYLTDENFLMITGMELDTDNEEPGPHCWHKSIHMCLYSKTPHNIKQVCYHPEFVYCHMDRVDQMEYHGKHYWRLHTIDDINYSIEEANKHGFFVTYNHPNWNLHRYEEDYKHYKGLWAIEVHNTGSTNEPETEYEARYDHLLRLGNTIGVSATDDMHSRAHFNQGWLMVKSPDLKYENAIDALLSYNYYASEGPEITECYVEDGFVHIKTSPVKRVVLRTEGRATAVAQSADGSDITEAVLKIPENAGRYFRLTVEGHDRKKAWTNAVSLDEVK